MPVIAGQFGSGLWSPEFGEMSRIGVSVLGKQGPYKFELESIDAIPPSMMTATEVPEPTQNDGAETKPESGQFRSSSLKPDESPTSAGP